MQISSMIIFVSVTVCDPSVIREKVREQGVRGDNAKKNKEEACGGLRNMV